MYARRLADVLPRNKMVMWLMSRQDEIVESIERAISEGRLEPGTRLPTVRQLSADFGVSGATVASAYRMLQHRGLVRGEVGRGTFVASSSGIASFPAAGGIDHSVRGGWRRRAVASSASRLRTLYPLAIDCTSGKPDPNLLPFEELKRAWIRAVDETHPPDLQYATPAPLEPLAHALRPRLEADGIDSEGKHIVVGSSAQQLTLFAVVAAGSRNNTSRPKVLVEEPGFQTLFDSMERVGATLEGIPLDGLGANPAALANAIVRTGADAVLFTPRAQNPTGRTWSHGRRLELANVLAEYPNITIIEDDQLAEIASSKPGSLITDSRLSARSIYIRSFAKAIAPDLRLAVALSSQNLAHMLAEAKSFSDGWSSRVSQRALATLLADPKLPISLERARAEYASRRQTVIEGLNARLGDIGVRAESSDGLNAWISLPQGMSSSVLVERAAASGVLVVSGEPFFVRPGNDSWIRFSVSQLTEETAEQAVDRFCNAVLNDSFSLMSSMPV